MMAYNCLPLRPARKITHVKHANTSFLLAAWPIAQDGDDARRKEMEWAEFTAVPSKGKEGGLGLHTYASRKGTQTTDEGRTPS